MNRLVPLTIAAGVLVQSVTAAQEGPGAVLTVRVYNYDGIENPILTNAQRKAASILNRAGAKTNWIACAASATQTGGEPRCATPFSGLDVVLKMLSHAMSRKTNKPPNTFGFAIPTAPTGLGSVSIFVKQAEQLAFSGPFSVTYDEARAVVMGHLIAHEIGHLLLGAGSHSQTGIMSFPWSHAQLRKMATSHLSFTDAEAMVIRDRLAPGQHESEPPQ